MGFGAFAIPILVAMTVLVFLCFIMIWAKNYKKVDPNLVAIITGRKRKLPDGKVVGYRLVKGGATLVVPVLEQIKYLPLSLITLPVHVKKAYNRDGVPVTIEAVANVKVKGEDGAIGNAVERFLGDNPEAKLRSTVEQTLEAHLRSIVGTLSTEELNSDRKAFAAKVTEESALDFEKMGIGIDSIGIKNISDEEGYLDALGKKRTAEVKRDALKGEAEATRDAAIAKSNAEKDAEMTRTQNHVLVAEAQKLRDVQVASFKAETDREQAKAAQAGALAAAEIDKQVRQAKVAAEAAETESRIALAEQETLRVAKELQYTQIKPAEAESQAQVIRANAAKQSGIINAEQAKEVKVINANAEFDAATLQANAIRIKAEADGTAAQRRGEGEAAAEKAILVAKAEGKERDLLAEAAGEKAKLESTAAGELAMLLAQADGKERLAKALAQLDSTGRLLQILDAAPKVAEALGAALAKALGPEGAASIFGQMALPLGNIDSVHIVDVGGGGNGSGNGISKFAGTLPNLAFQFLTQAKALGFNLDDVLDKLGLNSDLLKNLTTPSSAEISKTLE